MRAPLVGSGRLVRLGRLEPATGGNGAIRSSFGTEFIQEFRKRERWWRNKVAGEQNEILLNAAGEVPEDGACPNT